MKNFFDKILSAILPNKCLVCNDFISHDALFCLKDFKKLKFITKPKCQICSRPFKYLIDTHKTPICKKCHQNKPNFDRTDAIFAYNDTIAKAILDLKYQDNTQNAKKLTKLLINLIKEELGSYDIITSVPLHKKRLKQRKFNQAALICKEIAKKYPNLQFLPNLLLREKYVRSQAGLNKGEREENLRNSFIFNEKFRDKAKGKRVLLIDDVIASGATVENCAKELKKGGVEFVAVAVIARSVFIEKGS